MGPLVSVSVYEYNHIRILHTVHPTTGIGLEPQAANCNPQYTTGIP